MVLSQCKESEIKSLVDSLNQESLDLLMKYIYKCLETGQNTAHLFKWHKSVLEKGGHGTIVRALVERKSILSN